MLGGLFETIEKSENAIKNLQTQLLKEKALREKLEKLIGAMGKG